MILEKWFLYNLKLRFAIVWSLFNDLWQTDELPFKSHNCLRMKLLSFLYGFIYGDKTMNNRLIVSNFPLTLKHFLLTMRAANGQKETVSLQNKVRLTYMYIKLNAWCTIICHYNPVNANINILYVCLHFIFSLYFSIINWKSIRLQLKSTAILVAFKSPTYTVV